jgi:hypothetical protein
MPLNGEEICLSASVNIGDDSNWVLGVITILLYGCYFVRTWQAIGVALVTMCVKLSDTDKAVETTGDRLGLLLGKLYKLKIWTYRPTLRGCFLNRYKAYSNASFTHRFLYCCYYGNKAAV